jgi:hypothetical protein
MSSKTAADWYSPYGAWYYILQVLIYVFAAGLIADLVQVMNLNVTDTYFRELPGGKYFTLQFSSLQWTLLMLTNVKYMMPPIVMMAILFRRQWSCTVFWFILMSIVWFSSLFVFIGFARFYGQANAMQGDRDNFFNSPLWCCAPEVYSNPSNQCPNVGACTCPPPPQPCPHIPTNVAELRVNEDALGRFWVDFVFFLYHSFMVGFFLWVLAQPAIKKRMAAREKRQEDTDLFREKVQQMPAITTNKMTKGE